MEISEIPGALWGGPHEKGILLFGDVSRGSLIVVRVTLNPTKPY